jgi:uncharacterized protein (DUF1778 family)
MLLQSLIPREHWSRFVFRPVPTLNLNFRADAELAAAAARAARSEGKSMSEFLRSTVREKVQRAA